MRAQIIIATICDCLARQIWYWYSQCSSACLRRARLWAAAKRRSLSEVRTTRIAELIYTSQSHWFLRRLADNFCSRRTNYVSLRLSHNLQVFDEILSEDFMSGKLSLVQVNCLVGGSDKKNWIRSGNVSDWSYSATTDTVKYKYR